MSNEKTIYEVNVETGDVNDTDISAAGRDIHTGSREAKELSKPSDESSKASIKTGDVEESDIKAAGRDIVNEDLTSDLENLRSILVSEIEDKTSIDDLQNQIAQLKAEVSKPKEKRSLGTMKKIVKSIGNYISLATSMTDQVQEASILFEHIKNMLGL